MVFLAFTFNWRDKLKWVCFLLILTGFSFDLIGSEARKYPVAEGMVVESTFAHDRHKAILRVDKGELHERQYFKSGEVRGIVSDVEQETKTHRSPKTDVVEITTSYPNLTSAASFQTFSNLKFENISLVIELTLIFFMFGILFRKTPWLSVLSWVGIMVSLVFWGIQNIVLQRIHQFAGVYNAVTTILVISLVLVYFYYQLKKTEHNLIYASPVFWIVIGILLYKTGTFFLSLYANNLNLADLSSFYLFDSIFYILQSILFAISFMIPVKNPSLKYNAR